MGEGGDRIAIEGSDSEHQSDSSPPACFIISHSISKKHNLGTVARSATAFGVKEFCVVGCRQFNTFGSQGSDAHVAFRHFQSLEACCEHLRTVEHCRILGVEITAGAAAVQTHPFTGPTAFMMGNEGQGLSTKQMALCDAFVYIPQHGPGTASLNVAVAASIVLHHFSTWAGYAERAREGAKYVVAERPQRTTKRGQASGPAGGSAQQEEHGGVNSGTGDDDSWLAEQGFEPFGGGGTGAEAGDDVASK
ncbi:MAG: hypothetical protein WDW38_010889 [Sanguina aurantia]